MSLLNYLQYFAERKDKARERELQDSANQWMYGYDQAATPEARQRALAGINTAVPDITYAAKLQDFILKRDQAQQEAKHRAGINQVYENLARGKQTGGPLREGFSPLAFEDYTMPEALKMFTKYGQAGLEQFDKIAGSTQTANDAVTLANFRKDSAETPRTLEGFRTLQQKYPLLTKQADLATGLPKETTPYEGLSADYETFLRANGVPNSPQSYRAWQQDVIAQKRAGATQVSNVINNSKGQDKVDTTYAPEYVKNIVEGGIGDTLTQVESLENVAARLRGGEKLSGRMFAAIPESMLPVSHPQVAAARDDVLNTVQRSLREILGAQFTENEGALLLKRSYDVRLPPEENARRVERLARQLRVAAEAKASAARYFEERGTLTGYRGKVYTMQDFLGDRVPVRTPQRQGGARPQHGNDLSRAAQEELRRRGL